MATYIALQPVGDGTLPEHCVHGRATCVSCGRWVWLGDKSHDLVLAGTARPLCMPCAKRAQAASPLGQPVTNARDHHRADGPH